MFSLEDELLALNLDIAYFSILSYQLVASMAQGNWSTLALTCWRVHTGPALFAKTKGTGSSNLKQYRALGLFTGSVTALLLTSSRYRWPTLVYLNISILFFKVTSDHTVV